MEKNMEKVRGYMDKFDYFFILYLWICIYIV